MAMARLQKVQELSGHTGRVWNAEWSPKGDMLASCSGDKTVRIWERDKAGTWFCSAVLEETHTRTIRCCSWSPNGRNLATASFDATTAIWEIQGGVWEQVALLEGHENEVKGVAWAPSGNLLATCSRDKTVWVWAAEPRHEYECIDVKHGHSQDVKSVAWHPGGEVLVSTSYDDSIKLWVEEEDEWVCAQTLEGLGCGHGNSVWGVAFSPDGRRMASCSQDCSLRVWDCAFSPGSRVPRWRLLSVVSGHHERPVLSISWAPSDFIAAGSEDNSITVFRMMPPAGADLDPTGKPGHELIARAEGAHPQDVNCVRWHPTDITLLASASDDGIVALWRLTVPDDDGTRAMETFPE